MKITNNNEFKMAFAMLDAIIAEGFQGIPEKEKQFREIAVAIEDYEDNVLKIMPLTRKPDSLSDMLRLKMFEFKYKQRDLAQLLDITPTRLSEIMNGKRKVNIDLAKRLYQKLNIDPKFILENA
jgi:HTH-type transcriptional regulator / antitoxin HigA